MKFLARLAHCPHEGHTPNAQALAKYTRELAASQMRKAGAFLEELPMRQEHPVSPPPPPAPAPKPKTDLERVLEAYNEAPGASYREIGEKVHMGKDKVGELLKEAKERGLLGTGSESEHV